MLLSAILKLFIALYLLQPDSLPTIDATTATRLRLLFMLPRRPIEQVVEHHLLLVGGEGGGLHLLLLFLLFHVRVDKYRLIIQLMRAAISRRLHPRIGIIHFQLVSIIVK